jgi:hypothetical protein
VNQATIVVDHEILSSVIHTYLCIGMYRSYQFLAKVTATSTGKLLNMMRWLNCALVNYCHDPE